MARNQWFTAVEQTLPEHIPLPMEQLFQAGQAIQQRYDTNMANIDAVGTGLASIEARLSGHKQYVDNLSKNYRTEVDQLLTRFNNNASDPQFAREFNRIKTKYANDRNLSTIALANEAAKRNDMVAAELDQKGLLYINKNGTGLDENGNLISDVGNIRQVNTLQDWESSLTKAYQSSSEVGNMITNEPSLNKAKQSITEAIAKGDPAVTDLIEAYETRGFTRDQAVNKVVQDANRLMNSYNAESKTNIPKLQLEQSERHFRQQMAFRREEAKARSQAEGGSSSGLPPRMFELRVSEQPGARDVITGKSANVVVGDKVDILGMGVQTPIFATSTQYLDRKLDVGTTLRSGKVHEFSSNNANSYKVKSSYKVNSDEAREVAPEALFIFTDGSKKGKLFHNDESRLGSFNPVNGPNSDNKGAKVYRDDLGYYTLNNKGQRENLQPRAMMKYVDGDDKILYRELNTAETLKYFGPNGAELDGVKRTADRESNDYKILYNEAVKKAGRQLKQEELKQVDDAYINYQNLKEWNRWENNKGNYSTEDSPYSKI